VRLIRDAGDAMEELQRSRGLGFDEVSDSLCSSIREMFGEALTPAQVVERIVGEVRDGGDEAIRRLTRLLDGTSVEALEVPHDVLESAALDVPSELIEAMRFAANRIRRFHAKSMPQTWTDEDEGYGQVFNPVDSVGIYVPGGTAPLASTVLMTAIPARVAGVREVLVCSPPGTGRVPHPAVMAACRVAAVDRVFAIGGAQAVAAMAFGTESVPKVDLVCGPGNIFVTLAKKSVYGEVGIDGLYGPTETLIVADESANPTLCAADLVAQAEHDPMARPILITTSEEIGCAARQEALDRARQLERSSIAMAALRDYGIVAIVDDVETAIEMANKFAPEHLSLMVRDPRRWAPLVRNAGAVFLGEGSHEVLGDYVAGPSHAMPVGGTARFSSGINVGTFLKVSPVIAVKDDSEGTLARAAAVLGRAEGLTGHAEAAEIRLEIESSSVESAD
jgi:histidinol dehydrogenase